MGGSEESEPKVKKFHISMKLQQNSVPEPTIESSSPKKGPKIIIAKNKKALEEEAKPTKKLNKRRRKRKEQGLPIEDTVHETKGQAKAIQYLQQWNSDRENWKFEKCRQIWLLHNAYEKTKISEELFPVLLKYIASIKGGMRNMTLNIANKKLDEEDDKDTDDKAVKKKEVVTE